jgi:uncharacterized protein YdbL (DUF1318 family)
MKLFLTFLMVITSAVAGAYEPPYVEMNPPKVKPLLKKQLPRLKIISEYKNKNLIGEKDTGFLGIVEPKKIPEAQLKKITQLVEEENADRAKIYKEISIFNKMTKEQEAILIQNYFEVQKGIDPKGTLYFQNNMWQKKY